MASNHNWLAFSLSNNSLPSDSSQLCLFEALSASTHHNGGVDREQGFPDRGGSDLVGGPKLEDFLGGGGAGAGLDQFSAKTPVGLSDAEIYESELKTIAASFLRGFSSEQSEAQKQLALTPEPSPKKSVDTFGQRTSIYRGVTRHRWTGRYEAHLWDNSCRREGQSRKGRQVYLGGYDKEEKAARAYDLAALKYWGPTTTTNFPVSNYEKELENMKNMTRQEFVASLRRKSSGFSRGASIYRGVTRHHQHGRWQARIGRVAGNKDLYLGTFSTQEEAAEAYDIAAIKFRGLNAVTNFDMSRYDVKSIANSNLPIGGAITTGKPKTSPSDSASDSGSRRSEEQVQVLSGPSNTLIFSKPLKQDHHQSVDYWSVLGYQASTLNSVVKNPILESSFPFQTSSNLTMDFSTASAGFLCNGGGYIQQQQSNSSSSTASSSNSIPYATPVNGLNSSTSYEVSGYNSWAAATAAAAAAAAAPSLHSFQAAKPSLSVFQTPIFGME